MNRPRDDCSHLTPLWLATLVVSLAARASAQGPVPAEFRDDIPSDQPILALDSGGHTNAVYKLLRTDYADELISVGLDKTIRFWDLTTGEPTRVLRPPIGRAAHGYLFAAAIAPGGKLLAVGGYRAQTPLYDHRIHLIELPEGKLVHSLKGHAYAVYDLSFSPDGKRLASASHDGTVRIWDVESGSLAQTLKGHTGVVHAVAWSADGKRLVSGSLDKTARIWSTEKNATEAVLREHGGEIMTVAWSPDGRSVATGCNDHAVRLYEPSGKLRYAWQKLPNEITSIAFAPDSKRLLYTFGSNTDPPIGAAIVDMVDGHEHRRFTGHVNSPLCGVFLRDGKQAATGDSVSGIRVWNSASGAVVHKLEGQGKSVISVGWSPDGQALAWGNSPKNATINFGGVLERTFCFSNLDFGPPPDSKFSRSKPALGQLQMGVIEVGGKLDRRRVGIQKAGRVSTTFTLPQPYDQVRCYSLLAGATAAIGTNDGVYVIDTNTGLVQHELMDRGEEVWGLAPSADFRYLATAGNSQIVNVWNLASAQLLVSLFVAGDEWVAWTPQGYYAASLAGESLMGWHINRGPTQLADYYPASQFHKSLYRPDVIRRVLEAGEVYKALELADRERTVRSQKMVIADVLPPKISITAPAESSVESNDGKVTVRASAEPADKDPVTALRLIVNGRPYGPAVPSAAATSPPAEAAGKVEHEWNVELPPGKHELIVKAESADSYGLSSPIEVRRTAEAPAEGNVPAETGKLYVLAIGAAPGAANGQASLDAKDAKAIAGALEQAGKSKFSDTVTHVLTDAQATPEAIRAELEKMRSQMGMGDLGVVYYAGQASVNDKGEYRLSAGGAQGQHAISGDELKSELGKIPGRMVLVLDTLHNQEQTRRETNAGYCSSSMKQDGSKLETAESEWLRELLTEDYGVVVISSSRRANANSPSTPGASPLTQALSEALGGRADADRDGLIYLHELAPYLTERVRSLTGGKQTPTIERPRGVRAAPLNGPAATRIQP